MEHTLKRFGLKIRKYRFRRDLSAMEYRGLKVTNVPGRLRRWSNPQNKIPGISMVYPNFHETLMNARIKWWRAKASPWYIETMKELAKQNFDQSYDE